MPQLRQNIITGDWVVIAPERAKRPSDFVTTGMVRPDQESSCAFCVGSPAWQTRLTLPDMETDALYVIPNKYPAFVESPDVCQRRSFPTEDFFVTKAAVGGHDVIVVKDHATTLPKFSRGLLSEIFLMYQRRYQHYHEAPCRPEYIMGIYNHGLQAGASIWHPHAQVFASAVVPNLISQELRGAENYFQTNGVCVFCDLLHHELREKLRIQVETPKFVGFTFYAARFPFELMILPKTHASRFEDLAPADFDELSDALRVLFQRLDTTLKNPPLNFYVHSLPTTMTDSDFFHWHIEVAPRVTTYGGFEVGGTMIIDVVSPEKAAQFLRGEVPA